MSSAGKHYIERLKPDYATDQSPDREYVPVNEFPEHSENKKTANNVASGWSQATPKRRWGIGSEGSIFVVLSIESQNQTSDRNSKTVSHVLIVVAQATDFPARAARFSPMIKV